MSLPATLPPPIVETVLTGIAALFLAGAKGDMAAARQAASHMLAAYHPRSEDELRLAASIIGFSFHALEALGQAASPDMPLTRVLRLRGSAVSLSRQSANAQRRLTQTQQARLREIAAQAPQSKPQPAPIDAQTHVQPLQQKIEQAVAPVREPATVADAAKADGLTWTRAYENRQRDIRIAASLKRAEARVAAHPVAALPVAALPAAAIPAAAIPAAAIPGTVPEHRSKPGAI